MHGVVLANCVVLLNLANFVVLANVMHDDALANCVVLLQLANYEVISRYPIEIGLKACPLKHEDEDHKDRASGQDA